MMMFTGFDEREEDAVSIRRSIWVRMYFSTSKNQEKNTDSLKITEKNANLFIYQLALAA